MSLYNSRRLSSSQNDWVSLSSPWIQPSHNHNLFHPYNIYPQQIETHCPTLHHPRSHLIYVIFSADSSTPLSCPDIFRVIGSSLMTYLRARWMLIHFYISTDIQLKHSHTINHIQKQPNSLSCWWILPHTPPFTLTLPQHNSLSTSRWLHYVAHILHHSYVHLFHSLFIRLMWTTFTRHPYCSEHLHKHPSHTFNHSQSLTITPISTTQTLPNIRHTIHLSR